MQFGFSKGGFSCAAAAFLVAAAASNLVASAAGRDATLGTTSAKGGLAAAAMVNATPTALGNIVASQVYSNAQFSTAGIGLRNRGVGAITISAVVGPVKAAFLYWAVVSDGPPPAAAAHIQFQRLSPGPASTNQIIAGNVLGSGLSPCWGGDRITVFRGPVPVAVANGNGTYIVRLFAGAAGRMDGTDPWVDVTLPLFDGASLALVGTGLDRVAVYDRGLAGHTFFGQPGLSYNLVSPVNFKSSAEVVLHNIGADGQEGDGLDALAATSTEFTTLAGVRIAGRSAAVNDSDWNGAGSAPLPQLWDDTGHDVTDIAHGIANGTTLAVVINAIGQADFDCLTPVANVISVAPAASP